MASLRAVQPLYDPFDDIKVNPRERFDGTLSLEREASHKAIAEAAWWLGHQKYIPATFAQDWNSESELHAHMAEVWVRLRLLVPTLVTQAFDGDQSALAILYYIRRELDPAIEVPWPHIPGVEAAKLCERPRECYDRELSQPNDYSLIDYLHRIWQHMPGRVRYGMFDV